MHGLPAIQGMNTEDHGVEEGVKRGEGGGFYKRSKDTKDTKRDRKNGRPGGSRTVIEGARADTSGSEEEDASTADKCDYPDRTLEGDTEGGPGAEQTASVIREGRVVSKA